VVLLTPSDHLVSDNRGFHATVRDARVAADAGLVALIGVLPTRAETGYGYIRKGEALEAEVHRVAGFVEKPALALAGCMASDGEHLWNSGLVLARAEVIVAEIERWSPQTALAARAAVDSAVRETDFLWLDNGAVAGAPSLSFDRAVLERTDLAVVAAARFDWTDAGTWSRLWDVAEKDEAGNLARGPVQLVATAGSYVRSEGPMVVAVGVQDIIIIATRDGVLVAARGADAAVGAIAEQLERDAVE
jgi:mannose-1-phosphate guanylyltransferase/mannose-1-phosphate guanylyltransferase/mannose-6-phosphate isomerase